MSINLGLTNNENYNCIVGFSGKIINQEDLVNRKISSTKMLLIHGDQDAVVSSTFLLEAKDFLIRNNVEVETKIINNCEHHIPTEASSAALKYIKSNFNI
jgi:phospholipase/carboxylesterase